MIRKLLHFRLNFYKTAARNKLPAISLILSRLATKLRLIKNKPAGQALKCAALAPFAWRTSLYAGAKTPARSNILSTCGNVTISQLLEA